MDSEVMVLQSIIGNKPTTSSSCPLPRELSLSHGLAILMNEHNKKKFGVDNEHNNLNTSKVEAGISLTWECCDGMPVMSNGSIRSMNLKKGDGMMAIDHLTTFTQAYMQEHENAKHTSTIPIQIIYKLG